MYVWVRGHTVASLGAFPPASPSLNIAFHPVTAAFCASCACVWERGREYILVTGGGRVSLSVRSSKPNRIRARAFYPRLSRQRPVDPKRAGRAPSMLPSRNGCFCPRLCGPWVRVNVCACVSLPPMLRFLGPSCSGCLPSLSTGRARNLRHRNL